MTEERQGKNRKTEPDRTRVSETPWLVAKGFCMGAADVVPGVSGGTMALILDIYARLIDAVKSFDGSALRDLLHFRWSSLAARVHWRFLAAVLGGIFVAIIFFTRVVGLPRLMSSHPEPVYGLFFGLILGSIWFVVRDSGVCRPRSLLWLAAGTLAGLRVVTLMPADTPEQTWFVFVCGMIAVTAMILPGISGSFILLIMGKYEYIFSQFSRLGTAESWSAILAENWSAIMVLLPFGLGLVVGIVAFSRILSWLLRRWRQATYLVLAGFMLGSLWAIWPWRNWVYETVAGRQRPIYSTPAWPAPASPEFAWGLAMLLLGASGVLLLELAARRKRRSDRLEQEGSSSFSDVA